MKDGVELQAALLLQRERSSVAPLTIVIAGTIAPENSSGTDLIEMRDVDNVTLVGADAGSEFDRVGMRLTRANNITLRRIHLPFLVVGEKDEIRLEGHIDNAWIDHSELTERRDVTANAYNAAIAYDSDTCT